MFSPHCRCFHTVTTWLRAGRPRFDYRDKQQICLYSRAQARTGPTQHIEWVAVSFFSGVKRPGREANHLSSSTSAVKNCEAIHLFPIRVHDVLLKQRNRFTFYHYTNTLNCFLFTLYLLLEHTTTSGIQPNSYLGQLYITSPIAH
jgi:hypothetical protein